MSHSTKISFAASVIVLSLDALISLAYVLSISRRWARHKAQPAISSVGYEDEDGKATEESLKKFSSSWQKSILLPCAIAATIAAGASALLSTINNETRNDRRLIIEQWLDFPTWLLVLFQTIDVCRSALPRERYRLGAYNALSCFVIAVALAVENISLWMSDSYPEPLKPHMVCNLIQFILAILIGLVSVLLPRRPDVYRNDRIVDREKTASLLSRVTFSWPAGILGYATRNQSLKNDDLPLVSGDVQAETLRTHFESIPRKDKLWKNIFLAHKNMFAAQWTLQIIAAIFNFTPQIVLYVVLRLLEERDAGAENQGALWLAALGVGAAVGIGAWTESLLFYTCFLKLGVPVLEQIAAVVFGKAIRKKDVKSVSKTDQEEEANEEITVNKAVAQHDVDTVGKTDEEDDDEGVPKTKQSTINLIGVDAKRIADFATYNYIFLGSAIKILIAIVFLVKLIGPIPTVCGFLPPILISPINWALSKRYSNAQDELMKTRDQKMAVVTEALQGIRQIKFSALEAEWYEKIMGTRRKELKQQWDVFMYDAGLIAVWIFGPACTSAVALGTYALLNGQLTASVAFTTLSLTETLEMTMAVVPELVTEFLDAAVSSRRIQEYLDSAELEKSVQDGDKITFQNATISWPADGEQSTEDRVFNLRKLDLSFEMNELNVISGRTGSGKTLLLSALIGEADILEGEVTMPAQIPQEKRFDHKVNKSNWLLPSSIAYVSQIPWIENASLRDNITFGLPFDRKRYDTVVHACALTKDLEMLQDGDLTDIGANGINLSGGQKWRTSFARALYSRAGILVLDDIFSAVDAHVGRHLYEEALVGDICKGRTRILVTHHVALCLPDTKYFVLLENGRAEQAGTTEELRQKGGLQQILAHDTVEQKKQEEEAEKEDAVTIDDGGHPLTESETRRSRRISSIGQDGAERMLLTRLTSRLTNVSTAQDEPNAKSQPKKFTEEESRETGAIKLDIYKTYLKASRGYLYWCFVASLFLIWILVYLGRSYWISYWTRQYETEEQGTSPLFSSQALSVQHFMAKSRNAYDQLVTKADDQQKEVFFYVGVWAGISLLAWIIGVVRYISVYYASIKGSQILFERLANTILHTTLRFLDTTPMGRITNRFTSDFNMVDSKVANDGSFMIHCTMEVLSVIIAGLFVSPYMILLSVALLMATGYFASRYLRAAREVKRLESNAKSPIFEQFGSVLTGIATIRAFDKTNVYLQRMYDKINAQATCLWHIYLFNRWMSFRTNMMGALFSFATAALIVSFRTIDAPLAGFVLSYSLQLSDAVIWLLRQYTNLEINFNAVERVVEYSKLPTETEAGRDVSAAWPTSGSVDVEDLTISYAPDLPPVLKNLTFSIKSNERVGVVGRTGAGKSSLTLALFRFLEAQSGSITIDGIDVSKIKLHDLRSRLAIIPQDPVLFSGTVRSNLDPFEQHTDVELHDALARVHLVDPARASVRPSGTATPTSPHVDTEPSRPATPTTSSNTHLTLATRISESGLNLSSGQRQLLCLARAIVSQPKILVLDEATSSVDMQTDALIQQSIREEFGGRCTLIVIAHRLSTIADFDRVLVLGAGEVVEYGSPKTLLERQEAKEGGFKEMVEKSGERTELERVIFGKSHERPEA